VRGVIRTLLCGAVFSLPATYLSAEKTLTLVDRGQPKVIRTFAADVRSLLARHSVTLSTGDVITSGFRAGLPKRVEIRRAQPVVVVIDGERETKLVTGSTVRQVLKELDIPVAGATIVPQLSSRVRRYDEIVVKHSTEVKVLHDGMTETVSTNQLTVGGLLRKLNIELGPLDRVEPAITDHPVGGTEIRVFRVGRTLEQETSQVPFKRILERTSTLEVGVKKLSRPGKVGTRVREFQITYQDGKVRGRQLVADRIVQRPVDEIYLVGTYRPPPPALNVQSGQATWYERNGLCAAHKTLPMGTNVLVTNVNNGRQVTVTINDRGPFGSGRIIDLSDDAFSMLAPLGAGIINVKIAW
jgi:uncharacterized protein YabE (DUF348 family)